MYSKLIFKVLLGLLIFKYTLHSLCRPYALAINLLALFSSTESVTEIELDDLEFGECLGDGTTAVVFKGCWKSQKKDVAIKKFTTDDPEYMRQEVS